MKIKNHSNFKYLLIILFAIALSACVSTKKYEEVLSENKDLKTESAMKANSLNSANEQWIKIVREKNDIIESQAYQIDSLTYIADRQQSSLKEIERKVQLAFPSFSTDEIHTFVDEGYVHVSLDHRVLFNRGENELSERGVRIVTDMVNELNEINSDLMIIGHADSLPYYSSEMDNWQLSFDRAYAVMNVLTANGLPAERVIVAGRGKNDPFITNDHQIGRLLNRRIEIILMPDLHHVESLFTEAAN